MSEQPDIPGFDASRYLTKLQGRDYLEVKWRLVWFRDQHPDGHITTDLASHDDQTAVFRATVAIPEGGSATGWGSETYNDFRDYLEKAETKALGRALAALGYGTQFCDDFAFGGTNPNKPVVDAPIDFAATRGRRLENGEPPLTGNRSGTPNGNAAQFVTPRQLKFIQAIARTKGLSDEDLAGELLNLYEKASLADLTRGEASAYIDRLQSRLPVSPS